MHDFDTIVVGAGPAGLCAAKTILQCRPTENVRVLDGHASLGGVWAKEKLFPGLKTNNLHPTLDFTDFPVPNNIGVQPGQHLTGEQYHAYLNAYAWRWGVFDKIQLNTKVLEISRIQDDSGWALTVQKGNNEDTEVYKCCKLVIAIGANNSPHRPTLKGTSDFDAPIVHSSEIGSNLPNVINNTKISTVAVLGGGKSSYDAVYLAASSGKQVEWIIRRSGKGPAWIFPTHTDLGPFKAWRERLTTRRIVSFMSPCIWDDGFGWFRHFLHFTALGKKVAQAFWMDVWNGTRRDCAFDRDEKLHVLEPETNPFWYGTAAGINSYDIDFYSFIIKGQVRIHREDIAYLSSKTIHLADDAATQLHADALITATGFSAKPTISFTPSVRPECTQSDLGIPTAGLRGSERALWSDLDKKSDAFIGSCFPRLLIGPHKGPASDVVIPYNAGSSSDHEAKYTPWRLYRSIAPPGLTARGDRSLVYIGMFNNLANIIRLEIQCLWAFAYLYNRIPNLEADVIDNRIFEETSLWQRYSQHRSPFGHGRFHPDLVFDQVPYWDQLLKDLGLETRRKQNSTWSWYTLGFGGWLREIFEPYTALDYRGIVDEWLFMNGKR